MTDEEKRAKKKAADRAYYLAHHEERLAKNRLWREQNPERLKELNKNWYRKNNEYARAKHKAYADSRREWMRGLTRAWYQENREKVLSRSREERTGCTDEQYQEFLEKQNGRCAICEQLSTRYRLAADHCHNTEVVRGLLCRACNFLIGHANDDIEILRKAIRYLEQFKKE